VKVQGRRCRDKISLNNPAHSGVFREDREISVRSMGLEGLEPANKRL